MDRERIQCWSNASQHYAHLEPFLNIAIYHWRVIDFQQSREVNERFSFFYHILLSPEYAPGTIAVNVTLLERGFNACKRLAAYIHLSSTVSEI